MKLTSLLLLLESLFSVLSICKADDSTVEVHVFSGQMFRSEVCVSAGAPPVWKINDIGLFHKSDIERYYGRVDRNPPNAPGDRWAILTLEHVNFTLDGSVLSCSANSVLNYTLVVVNTTTQPLAPNGTFTPPVCKSPLGDSRPPYWMIDGVILNHTTVNRRYGAVITRLSDDSKGRHQAQLTINLMNTELIQNGSNVTCAVGNELRMVFILYITDPGEKTTTTVEPSPGSTIHADEVGAGTSEAVVNKPSSRTGNNEGITIGVTISVVILAAVVAVIILSVCVLRIRRKGWRNFFKTDKYERRRMDNRTRSDAEEDREEIDGVRHAPPHTSEEQKRERVVSDGPEEDGVHIVTADGPGIRRARAPRHTSEEIKPLLRQRTTAK